MADDIEGAVKTILAEKVGKNEEDLRGDLRIVQDLGADSLDVIEICMTLEEDFDVTIEDDDIAGIRTVSEAIACVREKMVEG